MQKEMKTYSCVTFLCRDSKSHEIKEHVEALRLNDWIEMNAPVKTGRLIGLLHQALVLLCCRADCDSPGFRGIVSPHILAVDRQDRVRLIDLNDESNYAAVRKLQSGSVTHLFAPQDWYAMDPEEAEIYGFGRVCQYVLAINEESGSRVPRALRRRLERFVSLCLGEGTRPIQTYERAVDIFDRIREHADRQSEKGPRKNERAPRLVFAAAALALAALMLFQSTLSGTQIFGHSLERDRESVEQQVNRLEQDVSRLQQGQEELRNMMRQ